MRRAVFSARARFRLVDASGESADFEIQRRGGDGTVVARSLDGDGVRTFNQLELGRALAERRLQFHLEGRHVSASADGAASIAPREPDFGALPFKDRALAQRRYDAIGPLLGKVARTAANVRERAWAASVGERTLWNWLCWYQEAGDIRALMPRFGQRRRGRPNKSDELHEIVAERLEARWLKRPPWPLTDVALEVIGEVERRNRERPSADYIPLTQNSGGPGEPAGAGAHGPAPGETDRYPRADRRAAGPGRGTFALGHQRRRAPRGSFAGSR